MGRNKNRGILQGESITFLITLISVCIISIFIGYLMGQYILDLINAPVQQNKPDNQNAINAAIDAQLNSLANQNSKEPSTPPEVSADSGTISANTLSLYRVQAGAFSRRDNAESLVSQLQDAGFEAVISSGPPFRVQTGAFTNYENAEKYARQLREKGFEVAVILP